VPVANSELVPRAVDPDISLAYQLLPPYISGRALDGVEGRGGDTLLIG
jgi:hypothetical protein